MKRGPTQKKGHAVLARDVPFRRRNAANLDRLAERRWEGRGGTRRETRPQHGPSFLFLSL